jgi:hypothetical protein
MAWWPGSDRERYVLSWRKYKACQGIARGSFQESWFSEYGDSRVEVPAGGRLTKYRIRNDLSRSGK